MYVSHKNEGLYQQKSKCLSSAERNYFVHFAMNYPVLEPKIAKTDPKTCIICKVKYFIMKKQKI